ncbi:MAG: OmpA family protein [Myxococcota bacterium]
MRQIVRASVLTITAAAALALAGCKPTYPACEKDEHCADKGEVCVNGTCQECTEDAQCVTKHGAGHDCYQNRCEVKPECRADGDCTGKGAGLVCRSNVCVPECAADTDCGSGMRCESQKCVSTGGCTTDQECGAGMTCVDGACSAGGTKVSSSCRPMGGEAGEVVSLGAVPFDFDKFDIRVDARSLLDQNVKCLGEAPKLEIIVEGHCDDRGTQEYNLALGEKRANAVLSYLRNMGIKSARMRTRSKGENEPLCREATDECHSQNRRVQFIQVRK